VRGEVSNDYPRLISGAQFATSRFSRARAPAATRFVQAPRAGL